MRTKLLGVAFALGCSGAFGASTAPTAPPQAVAAGFSKLVFDDEFTDPATFTSSSSATSGFNWYLYPWGPQTASAVTINPGAGTGALAGATGIATIADGVNIQSVPCHPPAAMVTSVPPAAGTFQHGYFEARLQLASPVQGTGGWPSFWSFGISAWGSDPKATGHTAECDFFEAYPRGKAGSLFDAANTLHDWLHSKSGATGTDTHNNNGDNIQTSLMGSSAPAQPRDGAWHTQGCLWQQTSSTTGYVEFYFDDHLIVHEKGTTRFLTGAGTGFPQQELDRMYLIMGGGKEWPINVDWVRVWQAPTPGATQVTPTPAPATAFLDQDIGAPAHAGSSMAAGGLFTLRGGGADIWYGSDQFHYYGEPLSGLSQSLVVHVDSVQGTDPWAKGGVMFRNSSAASSTFVALVAVPNRTVTLEWRDRDGAKADSLPRTGDSVNPKWLKLDKSGDTFTASYAITTGVPAAEDWKLIATHTTVFANARYLGGLAATAHNNSRLGEAVFDNFAVSGASALTTNP